MQPALFASPQQRRGSKSEHPGIYSAIQYLRRRGYRVMRAGRQHKVDSRLLTGHELLIFANGERANEKSEGFDV